MANKRLPIEKVHKVRQLLAANISQTEISQKVGLSAGSISTIKHRDGAIIERLAEKYIDSLPDVITLYKNVIRTGKLLSAIAHNPSLMDNPTIYQKAGDIKNAIELGINIGSRLMKATNLEQSNQQNNQTVVYAQINGGGKNDVLAPEVLELLKLANQRPREAKNETIEVSNEM